MRISGLLMILLAGCVSSIFAEGTLTLKVTIGPHYVETHSAGKYSLRPRPQMAFWLESAAGAYVADIFVTRKTAKGAWIIGETSRLPYVLPVWSRKKGIRYADGSYLPDSAHSLPDAVTGATPKESFDIAWRVPEKMKTGVYVIKAEINNSFDYNDTYTAGLSGESPDFNQFNGQPSLVLQGSLMLGLKDGSVLLKPAGTGDVMGRDGKITAGTGSLTTALAILDSVRVNYTFSR